jgi:hypothetical protein
MGSTYDPLIADFSYIEALSLSAMKAPLGDVLDRVEASLASGLFWRSYTPDEARIFCARLYGETLRYADALALLASSRATNAEADYVRIWCLYGMGKKAEARKSLSDALDRWPFDSRFPRLFLQREASERAEPVTLQIASLILSRLYLWEQEDRELLLLAIPFESDGSKRLRNIQIYRGMGKNDAHRKEDRETPLSTLLALEYGLLTEAQGIQELFAWEAQGIRSDHLKRLISLCGSEVARKDIDSRLVSYGGIIEADQNGDGIIDSRVLYRLGRPYQSAFDPNQDGRPDYVAQCDGGKPVSLRLGDGTLVVFDAYPAVQSVTVGNRSYTMVPLSLAWAPLAWASLDMGSGMSSFFVLNRTGKEPPLTEWLLIQHASYYAEALEGEEGVINRVSLEKGVPVAAELTRNGRPFGTTSYSRGYPSITQADRDDDGYFETLTRYDTQGRLESVSVDRNANRRIEYREEYLKDGTQRSLWDSNEDGVFEVSYSISPLGLSTTEWIHPETGVPVLILAEQGKPRSIRYGQIIRQVVPGPSGKVWWIGNMPNNEVEVVKNIETSFNRSPDQVVTLLVLSSGQKIIAIRTGGLVFAEMMNE